MHRSYSQNMDETIDCLKNKIKLLNINYKIIMLPGSSSDIY